jgi:hypothetical protein
MSDDKKREQGAGDARGPVCECCGTQCWYGKPCRARSEILAHKGDEPREQGVGELRPTDAEIELEASQWLDEHALTVNRQVIWQQGAIWARSMQAFTRQPTAHNRRQPMKGRISFPNLISEAETHLGYWKERASIERGEYTHLQGQHTALQRAFEQQGEELQRVIRTHDDYRREIAVIEAENGEMMMRIEVLKDELNDRRTA